MPGPDKPESTRIAIKFGAPLPSASTNKSSRPLPSSSLGKRPRPSHGLGGHFDSESEDDTHTNGRHERITAFGDKGAELEKSAQGRKHGNGRAKHGPLSIERQPNRDWRSEARARNKHGQRQSTPPGMRGAKASKADDAAADAEAKPIKWGLTITKPDSPANAMSSPNEDTGTAQDSKTDTPDAEKATGLGGDDDGAPDSEKAAVMALLGQTTDDRTKTKRVIAQEANKVTEDDAFDKDFRSAPDVSTLEDYEDMPVEEFGAALLRGMGWDGKDKGPKVKQVVRRPNQMGLGAKELKGAEDLGGWNNKTGKTGGSSSHKQRPPRLHDYRREEEKRKEEREERYRDSYKGERDRERDRDRDDRQSGSYHSSSSRHRSRHDR